MKSFIVAAMLVAAVAGQSFDMFNTKFDLMNKKFGQNEMLMKKMGYPVVDKFAMYGQKDLVDLPHYLKDQLVDKKIFTIEELYTTELFKEYMTLPLFREYITYPAFQKFVQSVYFQKFWTVPEFKQYFVNPVLFYKYVLPIVHLFKYDTTFQYDTTYDHQIVNKNVLPFVSGYERDLYVPTVYNKDYLLQDGHYYKNLLDKVYSHLYNIDETTTVKKIVDPITGEIKMIPFGVEGIKGIETIFGDKLVKDLLTKKFLLNKNVDLETIFGDKFLVDMLMKKNVDTDLLKKIILSKKFDFDTTIFGDKLMKDLMYKKNVDIELLKDLIVKKDIDVDLVKKILLNKMIVGETDEKMTFVPEMLKEKMMESPVYARMMYGYNKRFPTTMYNTKYDMDTMYNTKYDMDTMYNKYNMDTMYNKYNMDTMYNTKFDMDTMQKMNLFDMLTKKNKFETIDTVDKMDLFHILSKKDLVMKDKILLNKILADKINEIDNFGTYETVVPKMYNDVTKFERVPLTLEGVKPMMGVRTFDKKMMVPEIKA